MAGFERPELGNQDRLTSIEITRREQRAEGPDTGVAESHVAAGSYAEQQERENAAERSLLPRINVLVFPGRLRRPIHWQQRRIHGLRRARGAQAGRAFLDKSGGKDDRQADQQQHEGQAGDPVGQPHTLRDFSRRLEDGPCHGQVDTEHLPEGAAMRFGHESLEEIHPGRPGGRVSQDVRNALWFQGISCG